MPADSGLPPPPAEAVAHSQRLAEHIASTILAEGDWISFARFMELALYAPGLGYYAAGARKFGEHGDYVTSPEISPMFAKCIGLQAGQVLARMGGDVLELGPGSGVMAADLYESLKEQGTLPDRYLMLEVSPDLRERQRDLLEKRFGIHEMARFVWIDRLPEKIRGFVIANEVLDVVPHSLVHRRDGDIYERGVILTEAGFAFDDELIQEGEMRRRVQGAFPPGDYDYLSEVNFAAEALVRTIASSLEAGLAIFIDYGFPEREYYHPQRSTGTLRCHYRHRVHGDPFFMPGLQDITAHVDFTAMSRAAESAGAEVVGFTTQAYFLISCGLGVLVSGGDPTMTLSRLKGTSAVHRLINPSEMGELFKALGFVKRFDGPVLGFQSARHLTL
ncbi:MAG: SAM-dependent methyltransferase [Burkholderiales bacterium]|nr:SAM-dependent methyltransferase [Burkholderiales bacterium]